jgi:hypothetical protein
MKYVVAIVGAALIFLFMMIPLSGLIIHLIPRDWQHGLRCVAVLFAMIIAVIIVRRTSFNPTLRYYEKKERKLRRQTETQDIWKHKSKIEVGDVQSTKKVVMPIIAKLLERNYSIVAVRIRPGFWEFFKYKKRCIFATFNIMAVSITSANMEEIFDWLGSISLWHYNMIHFMIGTSELPAKMKHAYRMGYITMESLRSGGWIEPFEEDLTAILYGMDNDVEVIGREEFKSLFEEVKD